MKSLPNKQLLSDLPRFLRTQHIIARLGSLKQISLSESLQHLLALFQVITKAKNSEHRRRLQTAHRIGLTTPILLPIIYLRQIYL